MKYQELIILLPCHSLEDFPLYHEGDDAQGLLASWTALWHPALIHAASAMPTWARCDDPPEVMADRLIVIPSISMSELPTGLASRAKEEGACVIRKKTDRAEIVSLALESLDGGDGGVDAELAADFLALGFCYLQVQLLTRQMHYASNLDEIYFQNQIVAAAHAAVGHDLEESRRLLQACFDVLGEERDHFYPVEASLLDLTLVADTTLGSPLRQELADGNTMNLLISGQTLETLAEKEPETLAALKSALEADRLGLIGGEYREGRLPLLDRETVLAELKRGKEVYEQILGHAPRVFGRRRFGLTPLLPPVLQKLGYRAALHATLDDGTFPEGSQIKVAWQGIDGAVLEAIARSPLDASKPETFLNFSIKMGESMGMDHVAMVTFAHWPGQKSIWYDDLRRISRFGTALGKFSTIESLFVTEDGPPHDRFEADMYRSPYLKQAVIRRVGDPISSPFTYYQRRYAAEGANTLSTLATVVTGDPAVSSSNLLSQIDAAADEPAASPNLQVGPEADAQIQAAVAQAGERLAGALAAGKPGDKPGYLVMNPCSFARRVAVEVPDLAGLPAVEKPIFATGESHSRRSVVVDLPSLGFAWIPSGSGGGTPPRGLLTLAEQEPDFLLRNEFYEARFDATTGALRSVHDYRNRNNRFSQQLAMRLPSARPQPGETYRDPDDSANYSVMAADSMEVTVADQAVGEIVSRGRLMERDGSTLAEYRQTFRATRGNRVLTIDIEIEPKTELRSDPWNSYIACRCAWPDSGASFFRGVHLSRRSTTGKRLESPYFCEIEMPDWRTAIFTGGLPFHRRVGLRMLDTLLSVRGETKQKFRIGIGFDVKQPWAEALSLLSPPVLQQTTRAPANSSGYLFHIDSKNVLSTHWEPLIESGVVTGFKTRLMEAGGRSARAALSCFRPIGSAHLVNFNGERQSELLVKGDRIEVDLAAHEWIELEARWA